MIKFKKKKILITGGLGFIGSNLAHQLVNAEAEVTILDNNDPKSGSNIFNIKSIESDIELIKKDITNYGDTLVTLKNKDIVFNCAASTSHALSMKEPWLNLKTNNLGVLNLLEGLRELNSEASLVHVGTTTQIGALHYNPADEFHPEFPRDIYSANKVLGEKYVLLYSRAYGLRGCVVRLPNVYGPRAAIHSPDFTFNNFFIGLALLNKDINVYKPGNQLRNCIYIEDAVNALLLASQTHKSNGESFIAAGDFHYSVLEIAKKTVSEIGGKVSLIDWPKNFKSIEVGDAVFTNKKIKSLLGWEPSISLVDGLKKTKEYYSKYLENYLHE